MEIDFLRHFDFTLPLINSLRSMYGDRLLPLQERAIQEGRLFEGPNILICAPTSSGKTFLAEILFLHHALKGRNVILLVPTKALANQRFQQLQERYGSLGYDILLSTRDHPFHDRQILEGRFHLAVVIYEKMRALLSQNGSFISSLGACVVDEVHYLFHPTRGPDLEILLTRLRNESHLQILGLSAMVSDIRVAEWLRARLIVEKQRPVALRQGVLCRGRFAYREFNSGESGTERFFESQTQDEGEAMLEAARYFASQGEITLLFWPQRDFCYTAARKLAARYEPEDALVLPDLSRLESTTMRDFLSRLLPKRIAVHTSDLSQEEREWIERLANAGEIRILCATNTLAEGINFPVTNVLTTRRMYASLPLDSQQGKPPSALPISQDRLRNMIGRAGRLGLSPFGRGIVLTTSPGDVDGLLSLYMHSDPIPSLPQLPQIAFSEILLKTMGYCGSFTLESCRLTLQQTLSAQMNLFPSEWEQKIPITCDQLTKQGFLTEEMSAYYPTPLGNLIMKNGLSEISSHRLDDYIRQHHTDDPQEIEELVLVCSLLEMKEIYVPVSRHEIRSHTWSRELAQRRGHSYQESNTWLDTLLSEPARLRPDHHQAFKKALLIDDWIQGCPTFELEKRYGVYAGLIHRLMEEVAWLVGCLVEIVSSHAREPSWMDHLQNLQTRVRYGLPNSDLEWKSLIDRGKISRNKILELIQSGFHAPSMIRKEDREILYALIPQELADDLFCDIFDLPTEANFQSELCELDIDENRPDSILVNGKPIALTPMQFRLIRALSRRAGIYVDYKKLIQEMWPDKNGNKKQIFRQKSLIMHKIAEVFPHSPPKLIESLSGMGLLLNAKIHRK